MKILKTALLTKFLKIFTLSKLKGVFIVSLGSGHLVKKGLFVDLTLKSKSDIFP